MKRRENKVIFGILLLALGALLLMTKFGWIRDPFFDGWWTLLLIIPALVSMTRIGFTAGNMLLLALGVGFLLQAQGWNLQGYLVPVIFIIVGIGILFKKK